MCQSLYACSTASREVLVGEAPNTRPLKLGNDGKHIEPRTPPAFMSLTRSAMSKHPGRISS